MKAKETNIPGQMTIFDFLKEEPKAPGTGGIFRYLRYGPHTVIPEVAEQTRQYLTEHGVPDWVTWDKNSLPCQNCTWFDGKTCCSGGHTCHFEFDYLVCDMFRQSITERKPSTVGDVWTMDRKTCKHSGHICNMFELHRVADSLDDIPCPHKCCRECSVKGCVARCNGSSEPKDKVPVIIKGLCDDAYCPKCDYALDEHQSCDKACPKCHTPLDWTPWHKLNDDWWLKHLKNLDVK